MGQGRVLRLMKVIIGRMPAGTKIGFMYPALPTPPHEIRSFWDLLLPMRDVSAVEEVLYTTDRTLLDEITCDTSISYEDVSVLRTDGTLVPLLSLHPESFLSHFRLGDLYSRYSETWSAVT